MTLEDAWFRKAEKEAGTAVAQIVSHYWEIEGRQRREMANLALALYTGNMKHSISGGASILNVIDSVLQDAAAYNLIQASANTLINQLVGNRVRPLCVTKRGDSELRERAASMQDFVEGQLYETELYGDMGVEVCTYGMLFEGGGVEWYADCANERIVATLCHPWEHFTPRREARSRRARQHFTRTTIDRGELLAYYSEAPRDVVDRIKNAAPVKPEDADHDSYRDGTVSDMIVICKAWHLPSGRVDLSDPRAWGKGEKDGRKVDANHDGRHMCTLEDGFVLSDSPRPYDFFPQSWFKPYLVPGSAWSRGLPEILAPVQLTMNRWDERIDRIIDRHARPMIVSWKNAGIMPARITNELANILESKVPPGQAMQYLQSPGVPPELFQRNAQLRADGRDQIGLSDLSMQAARPQGVTSAPPMRHLQDRENVRHTLEFRSWERFYVGSFKNIMAAGRELAEYNPNYEAVFGNDKELKRIKLKTIDLKADEYTLKTQPTNLFAADPAARAEQLLEWKNAGLLTNEQALTQMDNPDTEALIGDTMAPERNIERRLDAICKAKVYDAALMPTPYMDLDMAQRLVVRRLNRLEADGEPEDKIERLIKFQKDIDVASAIRAQQLAKATAAGAQITQQSANPGLPAPNMPAPLPIQPMAAPPGAPMAPAAGPMQ
jgi:hypothetical protein